MTTETVLFKNSLKQIHLLAIGIAVVFVFGVMNHNRQKFFNDPVSFWTEALRTSPHSAYATMMLGARIDETDKPRSEALIRKAYSMDPKQKYINYYMGVLLQTKDSVLESEKYFKKEISTSDYFMCYFHLARVAFEKKDKPTAIHYLETYLNRNPTDSQANNNLLLLYMETNQKDKARLLIDNMITFGLQVPVEIKAQLQ
jgi:tetratricopeptide (TPR) repeat protein